MGNPWDKWRPKWADGHAYCTRCGLVTKGPQKGRYWPTVRGGVQGVKAADAERYYTAEEADAAGLEHNVSGGVCDATGNNCYQATLDEWRAGKQKPATGDAGTGSDSGAV